MPGMYGVPFGSKVYFACARIKKYTYTRKYVGARINGRARINIRAPVFTRARINLRVHAYL